MGVKITSKTNYPQSLKLANHIRTFLFEEKDFGELRGESEIVKSLKESLEKLDNLWSGRIK